MRIVWSKAGPRAKKIIALAKREGIPCEQTDDAALDSLAARPVSYTHLTLPTTSRV